jgi:hypothetical protein
MGMSRFPDPYQSRGDVSHATVFLVVILLLVVVGLILFFGNAWVFAPIGTTNLGNASNLTSATNAKRTTGGPPPTFVAPTPPPPLAGVLIQPTPAATASHPTATPAATPTATTPSPAVTVTPKNAQGTPLPVAIVANTGGDGVYLRHTPRLNDRWVAWRDNTHLVLLGNEADGDGQHWLQVRDPGNNVGWVPAQFVQR